MLMNHLWLRDIVLMFLQMNPPLVTFLDPLTPPSRCFASLSEDRKSVSGDFQARTSSSKMWEKENVA
jgi:hypothetical protein